MYDETVPVSPVQLYHPCPGGCGRFESETGAGVDSSLLVKFPTPGRALLYEDLHEGETTR